MSPNQSLEGALKGIRVIDFSRIVAGPHCTMCLADLGAEVIKLEDPRAGDDLRYHKPPDMKCDSPYFLSLNRNKSSVAVNLADPEGKKVVHDLLATADIVVENFRTGVMERHGVGYEDLREKFPRLIYCSISGYGREGSQKMRAAYDPVVQAESGQMATNGSTESGPLRTGLAVTDTQTGHFAVQGILAALFARERTGHGQFIEVPLFDVAVSSLSHYGIRYLLDGTELPRVGNGSNAAQPIGVFPAKDGKLIQVTCASERSFVQFAKALGRSDLIEDPRFAKNPQRLENRDELYAIVTEILATDTRDAWVEKMHAEGAPVGPINEMGDALTHPFVLERGLVEHLPHPLVDTVPNIRSPLHMSETPVRPAVAPPMHAQHTDEVLRDLLGYDEDRIAALKESGSIA
jgi:crotonobetainyl-CoA:carnitine CoA-transferase CaiB-like acyl-CoA transferase